MWSWSQNWTLIFTVEARIVTVIKKKARQCWSRVKSMLTVSFGYVGLVHHECAPESQTIDKEYYLHIKLGTYVWIKCAYVWMGLQMCTAPSANDSNTVRYEPKFVGFLRKHNWNWVCCAFCVRLKFAEN